MHPPLADEPERLEAVRALELLDSPPEERFDRITSAARDALDVPIALVSLVDADRQWFKSCQGLTLAETPRSVSFCAHAIVSDDEFEVVDARDDPRFADNPLVVGPPGVRAYLGKPLRSPSGHRVGTLCVLDVRPRRFDPRARKVLRDLAAWAELEVGVVTLKRALVERDRLRRRMAAILASVDEGIVALDDDGTIVEANAAMSQLTGRPSTELVGASITSLVTPLRDHVPLAGRPVRAGGEIVRPDGTTVDVRAVVAALQGSDEDATAVAVVRDVSEERAAERTKDEVIGVVAHELRTPLTAIRGSLGLLLGGVAGALDEEARTMLDTASRNVDRLVRLVNDMLDLERLAASRMPLERRPTDLADVARAAVEVLGPVAREREIELVLDATSAPVTGDTDRLVQAAANLLANAIRFSPPRSRIEVTTSADGRLSIRDQGPGIPDHEKESIFERFRQLRDDGRRTSGGSGLGLAITRAIVEAHGGEVQVSSEGGEGSTFTLVIPARI